MLPGHADFERWLVDGLEPMAMRRGGTIVQETSTLVEAAVLTTHGMCIRLENERGIIGLSIGALGWKGFWSVDQISSLFPRVRALEGLQRFSVQDQFRFIADRWDELARLFSPDSVANTMKRLQSHVGPNMQWRP